ncbi:MAG: sensor histidine kinase [Chitinophagales bacterium]
MEYDNDRLIKPSYRIEVFYWILLALFNPLYNSLVNFFHFWKVWPLLFIINFILLPAYIVYSRILVPKFLFEKKPVLFGLISLLFFGCIQLILWGLYSFLNNPGAQEQLNYFNYAGPALVREFLWCAFNMTLAIAIAFIKKALDEKDMIVELQKDNIHFRLKWLRAQLNPHFLFNTLNSIYSLSLQQSEKTPEVVVRLADIMRYLIEDCNEPKILLTKEIAFIQNYLEIEKVRHNADIQFSVEGETANVMIEPFLFISFVENGFTHAFNNSISNPFMYITLKSAPGLVKLTVINNTNIDLETQAKSVDGMGIRNSKNLLEILYPNAYDLHIIQTEQKERRKSLVRLKNARERLKLLYPDSHTLDVILNNNVFTVSLTLKSHSI